MCVSTASDRTASGRSIRGYWGVYIYLYMYGCFSHVYKYI